MSDNNTAPADSTKPAACGACGEVDGLSLRVMTGPGRVKVACPCGAEGPHVTTAEEPGDFVALQRLAFARWNAVWAPRVGEATKRVAAAMRDALGSWAQSDRLWINYEDCMGESVETADVRAMFAELGLAGGEGRG